MRVALSFPGCHRRGGVERVVYECASYLASRGHETHLFAAECDGSLDSRVTRHVVPVPEQPAAFRPWHFRRSSARQLRSGGTGYVHSAFGVESPDDGVLWVGSVHRAWLEISGESRDFKGRLRQRLNPFHPVILNLERRYYQGRRYRRLIALTEQVKSDLQRFYQVPDEDIIVLPNGFSPTEFNVETARERREAMRAELGYRPSDRVVIFVANELERKGFGQLLRAIAGLGDPTLQLLVVGRVTSAGYAGEIERLGLADRVRFTGPTSDVAAYYAAADVFALPTQYEAWGLVIVEALACGLPVVTSRLAGAAQVVFEGHTGELLDDPFDVDEISRRLGQVLSRNDVSAAEIAQSVQSYAWPNILRRYEALLLECAGETSGA